MAVSSEMPLPVKRFYAWLVPYIVACLGISGVTLVFLPLAPFIEGKPGTVAFVEVIIVLMVGKKWGRRAALFTSIIGALSWNYFFLRLTSFFTLENIQNWALLLAFLTTSVVIGQWAGQAMRKLHEEKESHREIERLYTNLQEENARRQQVETLLRKAPEELKKMVHQRTSALKRVNERLEEEILERKRIEHELIESQEQLRARSAHLEAIREEERKHIAMEIHDELGQLLTALKMDLSLLRNNCTSDNDVLKKIANIRELVEKTIQVVRNVATQLRPGALNLGIVPALEWLAENFTQRNHIPCKTDIQCGEIKVPDNYAIIIFRIVQESLTNVMRHAVASNVVISLVKKDKELELCIHDDGKGFDMDAVDENQSHGLFGIRERARLIGAFLSIESLPGKGTRIMMRIPFEGGEK